MKRTLGVGALVIAGLIASQVALAAPAVASDRAYTGRASTPIYGGAYLQATAAQQAAWLSGSTWVWSGVQATAEWTGSTFLLKTGQSFTTTVQYWTQATLKYGASLSGGFGSGMSASAGASSNWQLVKEPPRSLTKTNERKVQTPSSNAVVSPARDYRADTFSVQAVAKVKLSWDPWTYTTSIGT